MIRRIKRDFRQVGSPSRFLAFCLRVKHSLKDNPNVAESLLPLVQLYFGNVDQLEKVHHVAMDGSRSSIREREKLSQEIIVLLDQLASALESTLLLNPDALYTTGFSITQERRSTPRVKLPLLASTDFNVVNAGDRGKAFASASAFPGAFNCEIHINYKDPSSEQDWFHNSIHPDAHNMVLENLNPGNAFLRMRHHGPDGPGPWSGIVSVTIT